MCVALDNDAGLMSRDPYVLPPSATASFWKPEAMSKYAGAWVMLEVYENKFARFIRYVSIGAINAYTVPFGLSKSMNAHMSDSERAAGGPTM